MPQVFFRTAVQRQGQLLEPEGHLILPFLSLLPATPLPQMASECSQPVPHLTSTEASPCPHPRWATPSPVTFPGLVHARMRGWRGTRFLTWFPLPSAVKHHDHKSRCRCSLAHCTQHLQGGLGDSVGGSRRGQLCCSDTCKIHFNKTGKPHQLLLWQDGVPQKRSQLINLPLFIGLDLLNLQIFKNGLFLCNLTSRLIKCNPRNQSLGVQIPAMSLTILGTLGTLFHLSLLSCKMGITLVLTPCSEAC